MKALSGYPQWFWLMAKGWKDVENRTWPIPKTIKLPARIYLHASKHLDSFENMQSAFRLLTFVQVDRYYEVNWKEYQGAIIGEADIVDCFYYPLPGLEKLYPQRQYSVWHIPGQYGFTVANPVLYEKPIPYKGRLGFFEVVLPTAK